MWPPWNTLPPWVHDATRLVLIVVLLYMAGCTAPGRSPSTAAVRTQEPARPALDRLLTRGEVQVAEGHLRDFGFDPGPVDGLFTAQTHAAVRAFQARYGFSVSGLLDRETRRELLPGLDQWEFEP